MLRFAAKPSRVFAAILDEALRFALDDLDEGPDFLGFEQSLAVFEPARLREEIDKLLVAHRSDRTYSPTDYHWLILYEAVHLLVELHNDALKQAEDDEAADELPVFGGVRIGKIDFDWILGVYWWDTDFLTNPALIDAMGPEAKSLMRFTDETFGVVHGLQPHPDELLLEERPMPEGEAEHHFEDGEDYPYFPDEQ